MVNLVFYPVSFRLQRLGLQSGGHDAKPQPHQAPWGEAVGPPPLTPADIGVAAGPCADRIGRTASLGRPLSRRRVGERRPILP